MYPMPVWVPVNSVRAEGISGRGGKGSPEEIVSRGLPDRKCGL